MLKSMNSPNSDKSLYETQERQLSAQSESFLKMLAKRGIVEDQDMGAYMRKFTIDGYIINLDLSDTCDMVSLLRRCSNNLNQYAKRVNETGRVKTCKTLPSKLTLA